MLISTYDYANHLKFVKTNRLLQIVRIFYTTSNASWTLKSLWTFFLADILSCAKLDFWQTSSLTNSLNKGCKRWRGSYVLSIELHLLVKFVITFVYTFFWTRSGIFWAIASILMKIDRILFDLIYMNIRSNN